MTNFLLLARGENVASARVLAISADQDLVDQFLRELAGEGCEAEDWDQGEPLRLVDADGE